MGELQLIDFAPAHADAFRRLNLEWLEKYFWVEEIDQTILSDPQAEIIDHGGHILFARIDDEIVGTVALKHHGDGTFELTKMSVTSSWQGAGIGRALMIAAIERFDEVNGRKMYLETHISLGAAIALYESAGFVHRTPPTASEYARADTYMVYSAS